MKAERRRRAAFRFLSRRLYRLAALPEAWPWKVGSPAPRAALAALVWLAVKSDTAKSERGALSGRGCQSPSVAALRGLCLARLSRTGLGDAMLYGPRCSQGVDAGSARGLAWRLACVAQLAPGSFHYVLLASRRRRRRGGAARARPARPCRCRGSGGSLPDLRKCCLLDASSPCCVPPDPHDWLWVAAQRRGRTDE